MSARAVLVEYHPQRVAVLTFNRPERMNSWTAAMRQEILASLAALGADTNIGSIVFTGAGRAFSAGQDLGEIERLDSAGSVLWVDDFARFFDGIRRVEKPLIAAITGAAVGSGLDVALLCDFRIAHATIQTGIPDINFGVPSAISAWLLRETIGTACAIDLLMSGRLIDGREAFAAGLVTTLVPAPRVLPTAISLAQELAAKPSLATTLTRRRWRELTQPGFEEAVAAARSYQQLAFDNNQPGAHLRARRRPTRDPPH